MSGSPRFTIGLPTIGDNAFLAESFRSALANLGDEGEIVISDNASGRVEYIGDLVADGRCSAVRVVQQSSRLAMADNWNACLAAARGRYFLLLSDDDVILPGMVEQGIAILELEEEVAAVYVRVEWIDESGRVFWTSPSGPPRELGAAPALGVF